MKYLVFCVLFLLLLVGSFTTFAWLRRTDIIASMLERSAPPYSMHIEKVSWGDCNTLIIGNIALQDGAGSVVLRFSEARLKSSLTSWLCWFLVPSQEPLALSKVVLTIEERSPCSFSSPQSSFLVSIDEMVLKNPDGTEQTYVHQTGLLSEIMTKLFTPSNVQCIGCK